MAKHAQELSNSGRESTNTQRRERVRNALIQAGLISANPAPLTHARPLPDDQRSALARQVARGRPLSAYIREERERR